MSATCCICFEDAPHEMLVNSHLSEKPVEHLFHLECLCEALNSSHNLACPVCRDPISVACVHELCPVIDLDDLAKSGHYKDVLRYVQATRCDTSTTLNLDFAVSIALKEQDFEAAKALMALGGPYAGDGSELFVNAVSNHDLYATKFLLEAGLGRNLVDSTAFLTATKDMPVQLVSLIMNAQTVLTLDFLDSLYEFADSKNWEALKVILGHPRYGEACMKYLRPYVAVLMDDQALLERMLEYSTAPHAHMLESALVALREANVGLFRFLFGRIRSNLDIEALKSLITQAVERELIEVLLVDLIHLAQDRFPDDHSWRQTVLLQSLGRPKSRLFKLLCEHGFSLEEVGLNEAINFAIEKGSVECTGLLLDHADSVNQRDLLDFEIANWDICRMFLERRINLVNVGGDQLLSRAASEGKDDVLLKILELRTVDEALLANALLTAAESENWSTVNLLLDRGVKPQAELWAMVSDLALLKRLHELGLEIDISVFIGIMENWNPGRNPFPLMDFMEILALGDYGPQLSGQIPLCFALRHGHISLASSLIACGASTAGWASILEDLLEHQPVHAVSLNWLINEINEELVATNEEQLCMAVKSQSMPLLKLLLSNPASVRVTESFIVRNHQFASIDGLQLLLGQLNGDELSTCLRSNRFRFILYAFSHSSPSRLKFWLEQLKSHDLIPPRQWKKFFFMFLDKLIGYLPENNVNSCVCCRLLVLYGLDISEPHFLHAMIRVDNSLAVETLLNLYRDQLDLDAMADKAFEHGSPSCLELMLIKNPSWCRNRFPNGYYKAPDNIKHIFGLHRDRWSIEENTKGTCACTIM